MKTNLLSCESMKTFHRLKPEIGIKVLEKHNYQCVNCNAKDKLCVHHIKRVSSTGKEYNNIKNLTILCRKCHMSYHRKAGHIMVIKKRVYCHCGKLQHAKGLCRTHYRLKYKDKWYGAD